METTQDPEVQVLAALFQSLTEQPQVFPPNIIDNLIAALNHQGTPDAANILVILNLDSENEAS